MGQVWVNSRLLDTSQPKAAKWNPAPAKERVIWGLCACGEVIREGDSVGMWGEHVKVICYACWMTGEYPEYHCDCAGLKFPDATLSQ